MECVRAVGGRGVGRPGRGVRWAFGVRWRAVAASIALSTKVRRRDEVGELKTWAWVRVETLKPLTWARMFDVATM